MFGLSQFDGWTRGETRISGGDSRWFQYQKRWYGLLWAVKSIGAKAGRFREYFWLSLSALIY